MASEHSVMAVIRAARPNFRNSQDKVAFAVNATFLVSGYVLNATGPPAFADDSLSSSSTEEVGIDRWNELDGEYAFLYVIPGKTSEKTLVKCLAMNDKLLVAVLATGTKEPLHLEIDIGEYVSDSGGANYSDQFKNLDKLVKSLQNQILSKLDNGSNSSSTTATSIEVSSVSRRNRSDADDRDVGVSGHANPQIHPSGIVVPP
ncbi:probable proteasome inhibitor, partial [Carica papaya]|uniref:probable proteasome inhibitor n=1 Tax=Carica papaya TaxID=3649 RepID=UPI000B8CD98C